MKKLLFIVFSLFVIISLLLVGCRGNEVKDNNAPVLRPIGDKTVNPGETLTFTVMAIDEDSSDILSLSASNLPDGAVFDTETGEFNWTPASDQIGDHEVIFTVSDGELTDSETITITVSGLPSGYIEYQGIITIENSGSLGDGTIDQSATLDVILVGSSEYNQFTNNDIKPTTCTASVNDYFPGVDVDSSDLRVTGSLNSTPVSPHSIPQALILLQLDEEHDRYDLMLSGVCFNCTFTTEEGTITREYQIYGRDITGQELSLDKNYISGEISEPLEGGEGVTQTITWDLVRQ